MDVWRVPKCTTARPPKNWVSVFPANSKLFGCLSQKQMTYFVDENLSHYPCEYTKRIQCTEQATSFNYKIKGSIRIMTSH